MTERDPTPADDDPAPPASARQRPRSQKWLFASAVAAGVIAAVVLFGVREWTLRNNLRKAADHARGIADRVAGDERFLGVKLGETSEEGGSMYVAGFVVGDAPADELRRLIDDSRPPVNVIWNVRVFGPLDVGRALGRVPAATTAPATAPADN